MFKYRFFSLVVLVVLLVGSGGGHAVFAQQIPLSSNYLYNEYLLNPAAVGLRGHLDVNAIYRRQFVNVPGAPEHQMVTLDGFVDKKNFGAGLTLFNQSTGVLRKTGGSLAYAYRKRISDDVALRAGFNGMVAGYGLDWEEVVVQDEADLGQLRTAGNRTLFDGGFGLFAEIHDFNVGASMAHLFNTSADFQAIDNSRSLAVEQTRHLIGYADYTYTINEQHALKPVVVGRYSSDFEIQYDANLQYIWNNDFFFNLAYRSDYAVSGGFGVRFSESFLFSYQYDFPFGDMGEVSQGSHEFMLGFRIADARRKSSKDMGEDVNYLRNMQEKLRSQVDSLEKEVDRNQEDLEEQQQINERQQEAIDDLMQLKQDNQQVIDSIRQGRRNGAGGSRSGSRGGGRQGEEGAVPGENVIPDYNYFEIEPADIPNPYKVVVGSFRSQDNALRFQQELKRLGVEQDMEVVPSRKGNFFNEGEWYFVTVEGFDNPRAAQSFVRDFNQSNEIELNGNPWVYVVPK